MRIGLFGGTFDPPHVAHLIVAQDALIQLRLDRVVFIPAAMPPHKQDREISPAQVRLAMLRAAIGDDGRFDVDDIEIRRGGASYTVDTLRAIRARLPEAQLFLLLGADQYRELGTWREPDLIRRLATLVVLSREGDAPAERVGDTTRLASSPAPDIAQAPRSRDGTGAVHLAVTRIDVSATEIRRRVRAGEPIRYLVVPAVKQLIEREGLYRQGNAVRTSSTTAG